MNEPDHYVYRAYDAAGLLLYIGCTGNPKQREGGHKSASPWFQYAVRFEYEGPYHMGCAYSREDAAIESEQSFFNATHADRARSQANRAECRRRLAGCGIPSAAYFDDDAVEAVQNAAADEYVAAMERMRRSIADTHPYLDFNDRMARYLEARKSVAA